MKVYLNGYEYVPSSSGFVQGVKYGKVPRGAVAGGNGSFIVASSPQIYLLLVGVRGGRYKVDVTDDFVTYIHGYLGKKVTEKQVRNIVAYLEGKEFEYADGKLEDLGKYFPD